jgi:biotin operon repressor
MTHSATPEEMLRALADPGRLAVAGALARASHTARELADEVGIPVASVRRHLSRLTAAGVAAVDADRRTYRLLPEALRRAATEVGPARDAGLALGAIDGEEESVLRAYFRGGRLREIPAKLSKRRIVLTRLAIEFEIGVGYPERAVNAALKRYNDDYATLRRYLVDEGFLSREGGTYWRSGGPADV